MNRSEMRQRVKEYLSMSSTDPASDSGEVPTNSQINSAIKEARDLIYAKLQAEMPRRFGSSTDVAYTAEASSVSLPAAALGMVIHKVETKGASETYAHTLDAMVIEEFRNLANIGYPLAYAVEGSVLLLRPRPSTAQTVTLWHTPIVTDLADGTSPTEYPVMFHHLIPWCAALRIKTYLGDNASAMRAQFDDDFRLIVAHFENLARDTHVHEVGESGHYYTF